MRRLSLVCVALLLALVVSNAVAEVPSIDGLGLDDLVALKDQLNLAIWNSSDWQEVTIPQGIWEIGVDIPVGHWTIKAADGAKSNVYWGDLDDSMARVYSYEAYATLVSENHYGFDANKDRVQLDWELTTDDELFIEVKNGSVTFTPYEGKPAFNFK